MRGTRPMMATNMVAPAMEVGGCYLHRHCAREGIQFSEIVRTSRFKVGDKYSLDVMLTGKMEHVKMMVGLASSSRSSLDARP